MADSSRNLIVLSDGTGNSASKPFKTNVWRLYQAITLTDGSQIAAFGDGVGTSSVKILRVLGLALGIGVKRNVLNLYKFLCRNYEKGSRIWAFGFSRGAFTVRVLAGLIHYEGLVTFESEAELNRNALAAYRAYRRQAFATKIPWVGRGNIQANGHPGGGPWRQLHCIAWGGSFREPHGPLFHGQRVPAELLVRVAGTLAEGLGIRVVARVFEVDPNTVLGWLSEAADHLQAFSRYCLHDLQV